MENLTPKEFHRRAGEQASQAILSLVRGAGGFEALLARTREESPAPPAKSTDVVPTQLAADTPERTSSVERVSKSAEDEEDEKGSWASRTRAQCFKTRICRFFLQHKCSRGPECLFAHSPDELRHTPDLSKTKICDKWKKGSCMMDSVRCSYAHGFEELRVSRDAPDYLVAPPEVYRPYSPQAARPIHKPCLQMAGQIGQMPQIGQMAGQIGQMPQIGQVDHRRDAKQQQMYLIASAYGETDRGVRAEDGKHMQAHMQAHKHEAAYGMRSEVGRSVCLVSSDSILDGVMYPPCAQPTWAPYMREDATRPSIVVRNHTEALHPSRMLVNTSPRTVVPYMYHNGYLVPLMVDNHQRDQQPSYS